MGLMVSRFYMEDKAKLDRISKTSLLLLLSLSLDCSLKEVPVMDALLFFILNSFGFVALRSSEVAAAAGWRKNFVRISSLFSI